MFLLEEEFLSPQNPLSLVLPNSRQCDGSPLRSYSRSRGDKLEESGIRSQLSGQQDWQSPDCGRRDIWSTSHAVAWLELTFAFIHRGTMRVTMLSSTTGK